MISVDWSGRCRLVRKCKKRIFSCGAFLGMIIPRPAGEAGQRETPQALAPRRMKCVCALVSPDKRSSKMQKTHFLRAMFMLPKHTLVVGLKEKSLFDFT
ncbi:hypothetical protein [Bacillus sp. EB01]|uniref:hypothetical protein n=1 Tax=Bacillus sp. EB01 TaxID=1347086 RepID=UPI0005C78D94|nr:hypothetical protein [Bacillus sp. EB01]